MVYTLRKGLRSSSGTVQATVWGHCIPGGERAAPIFVFWEILMNNHERWTELCELASEEQDPERLVEIAKEIIRVLDEKEA